MTKTEMILAEITNEGFITYSNAMNMADCDSHNLLSAFRQSKLNQLGLVKKVVNGIKVIALKTSGSYVLNCVGLRYI